jgi:hypothetical protein
MRYRVKGWIGGQLVTTVYQVPKAVDAREVAQRDGMTVVDVLDIGTPPTPETGRNAHTRQSGVDSPILCAFVGFVIPIAGLIMAVVKCRKDPQGAAWCLVGAVVGMVLFAGAFR